MNKGFTLIELMIVVAIIGILAAVALPAYQSYTIRAQLVEALVLVDELKPNIKEYYKDRGRFPKDNEQAGLPGEDLLLGNYVQGMAVANGAVHITMGNKVNQHMQGKILSLRPIVVAGSPASPFSWVCGNSEVPDGMEAAGDNNTDIPAEFLPSACRI